MIMSLFRRNEKKSNAAIVSRLYQGIIDAGRQPVLYAQFGVPDTPIGRYEAIGLHIILFLYRVKGATGLLEELSQDVLDEFFLELDHSIRELGVGDAGVPRRMKKLGKMFYGRIGPYWTALDEGDRAALAQALVRNITPGGDSELDGAALAAYMLRAKNHLETQTEEAFLSGAIKFPAADGSHVG